MSKGLALVVPLQHGDLPTTLVNTLGKALQGAILVDDCLVLPLASIQLWTKHGGLLTISDLLNFLTPLADGSVSLSEYGGSPRDFSIVTLTK